ncbi:aspartate/glutamate racemase family protein [Actinacidiphila acididurans]|uniref:Aspartate/glutamate racemase family protein n=1 Tax=Actinacidiphila acididurans TaxID=2784346 RepID=A0ABS2TL12_9ACTN|nr:aspartate/glutamate racemase family protein [Actinacidiphila acididurans]MBM9504025.1 aspartate/glutamate racemase family protein [Actinacidiphila acididurans]
MSRTIMVVNPNTTRTMTDAVVAAARTAATPGTTLVGGTPTVGTASVESHVDEVWGAVGVLEQVRVGEQSGVDGYVIACFGDTGVQAARELARGPVVGMTEAALFTAALVAARFTIVTLPRRTREMSDRVLRDTGLSHRCTVRAIDVPVADIAEGALHELDAVAAEASLAIAQDAAEALVLGCAGLADLVGPLRERLGVPVIEGVAAAVAMVDGLLAQGVTTSRAGTYAAPDRREPSA